MDSYSPMNDVNMLAKLADLKDGHYHNLLMLSALIELLIEKGILTREELEERAVRLDEFTDHPPYPMA
ncbi:nitrile hydratase subunit beta [Paenibacillus caui]|uniref:nitrile hydratase subunit beta n=1 Tax=Paenibacillus caui TaxID=2873927 RepID=UPI001CA9B821|nr:nitrile hydratase subunit beta [Paenibacillus caui]